MRIPALVITGLLFSISLAAQPVRINAGGPAYTDPQGVTWAADTDYISGFTWATGSGIAGTSSPALYQTCRYGVFTYQLPVSNGNYTVNLKFAEVSQDQVGERVFNVAINGSPVLENFDILAQTGAPNVALDKSFPVAVSGGQISIQFTNGPANSPLVSAIEVLPANTGTAPPAGSGGALARVNAGGGAYTDSLGQAWSADTGFAGGYTWSTGSPISNTAAQPLYQTCRYGEFTYQFAAPDGNYNVNLKFAEVSQNQVGERVFNVAINGVPVLTNFDILAHTGAPNVALDESFPVSVAGGQIAIQFINGPANSPLVSAIEIVPAAGTAPPSGTQPSAGVIAVPSGGDLQAAIDGALPGQTIVLQAGAVYTGSFHLPNKSGSQFITIQSSALASLPPDGTRVGPADAPNMAKVQSYGSNVFYTDSGAHHYRLVGLELAAAPGANIDTVVAIGNGSENTDAQFAHDIELDRDYIHGDPVAGTKRGVSVNGRNLTVRDSYLSDFKRVNQDTQAICGWNGSQYITIQNNYLEAAAENVLFLPDATAPQYIPADITVRGNYLRKPLSWKADDPSFNGTHWSIKNLFELKGALRVTVDGNVMENCWTDAQDGFAVVFFSTEYNWGVVQDVTFTDNIVRHAAQGVNICGDGCAPGVSVQAANTFHIANNFFEDIGTPVWTGGGSPIRLFQVIYNASNVDIQHNTAIQNADILFGDGSPCSGLIFRDNIVMQDVYGVVGTGTAPGIGTLNQYYPGAIFQGNAIIGGNAATYPPGNLFPADIASVGFTAPGSDDYSLAPGSSLIGKATDGANVGADWTVLAPAAASAINGHP